MLYFRSFLSPHRVHLSYFLKTIFMRSLFIMNLICTNCNFPYHRCVSEDECYNKWLSVSRFNPSCLSKTNTPTGNLDDPIECDFCCKGAGCNNFMRIPDNLLYSGEDHPANELGDHIFNFYRF
jgi:hypothetical protein